MFEKMKDVAKETVAREQIKTEVKKIGDTKISLYPEVIMIAGFCFVAGLLIGKRSVIPNVIVVK